MALTPNNEWEIFGLVITTQFNGTDNDFLTTLHKILR